MLARHGTRLPKAKNLPRLEALESVSMENIVILIELINLACFKHKEQRKR